jgi:hypothetical protein
MSEAPNAWKIMKALECWNEARKGLESDGGDDILGETNGESVEAIAERLVYAIVENENMAELAKNRMANLKLRKDRFERRSEKLREVLTGLMVIIGEKKMEFPEFSATITQGRDGVNVTDQGKLSLAYQRCTTTWLPDKAMILSDLKEGVVIEGAELKPGKATLTVRTK